MNPYQYDYNVRRAMVFRKWIRIYSANIINFFSLPVSQTRQAPTPTSHSALHLLSTDHAHLHLISSPISTSV